MSFWETLHQKLRVRKEVEETRVRINSENVARIATLAELAAEKTDDVARSDHEQAMGALLLAALPTQQAGCGRESFEKAASEAWGLAWSLNVHSLTNKGADR